MRIRFAFVTAMLFGLAASGAAAEPLIAFGEKTPGLTFRSAKEGHRGEDVVLDGRPAYRMSWPGNSASHLEFWLVGHLPLPPFERIRVRAEVYVPPEAPVRALNLRLGDADGETFQFAGGLPDRAGWHTLTYDIDRKNPGNSGVWGGKTPDGKLTPPLSLVGFGVDFRDKAVDGALGLGAVSLEVLVAPVSVRLDAGRSVHVALPGEDGKLALVVANPDRNAVTGVIRYRVVDMDTRETVAEAAEPMALAPGAECRVPLATPSRFGVYRVECAFGQGTETPREHAFRFAHMPPAGPTPGPAKGFLFGVCGHPQLYPVADQERMALAAALCGAKVLREDLRWSLLQNGGADHWNFVPFDRVVDLFGRQDIEIAPIYGYCAGWAAAKDWKPVYPAPPGKKRIGQPRPDSEHWARMVRTVTERYKDRIRFIEIWNEPDLAGFANFTVEEYAELLEIAYRVAGHLLHSSAPIRAQASCADDPE